jgi:hypothetical protein
MQSIFEKDIKMDYRIRAGDIWFSYNKLKKIYYVKVLNNIDLGFWSSKKDWRRVEFIIYEYGGEFNMSNIKVESFIKNFTYLPPEYYNDDIKRLLNEEMIKEIIE